MFTDNKIPHPILWLLDHTLRYICGDDVHKPTDPNLLYIWTQQEHIGIENFALGWISKEWARGLKRFGSDHHEGQAAQILTLIWDGLVEPIWTKRNDIKNNNPNPNDVLEMRNLRDKLYWYKKYSAQVLPERLRMLIDYPTAEIKLWDRKKCRRHINLLKKAQEIYKIECQLRAKGQTILTDFYKTSSKTTSQATPGAVDLQVHAPEDGGCNLGSAPITP